MNFVPVTHADVDLDVLKYAAPLLDIIGRDTVLKRESASDGGSWCGPCPFCGGTDRLTVRPQGRPSDNLPPGWMCRGCRPKGGSVIDYVILRHGVTFQGAVEILARDHGLADLAPDRVQQIRTEVTAAAARETMRRETARMTMASTWQPRLGTFARELQRSESHLARLAAEGVGWIGVQYCGFGLAAHRGVPSLVIPWRSWDTESKDYQLDGVQLRALTGQFPGPDGRDRRYEFAYGSRPAIFNDVALQPSMCRDEIVIVEGAKKAAALIGTGEAMVVAIVSRSAWRAEWAPRFSHFRRVVVCLDPDAYGDAREIALSIRGAVVAQLSGKVDDLLAETDGDIDLIRSYWKKARVA